MAITNEDIFAEYDERKRVAAETPMGPPRTPVLGYPKPETDLERSYREALHQQSAKELAERGTMGDLTADVLGGVVDAGSTMLNAAQALTSQSGGRVLPGEEPGFLERGIRGIEQFKEEHPILQENPNEGSWGKAIHGGVRSATQSMASGLPGMAAGALTGMAVGGPVGAAIGGVLGFATSGATTFGLNQYNDVLRRADAAGISREQSEPAAIREGIYEGGFEFLGDLLQGATMGAGSLLTAPGKQAAKIALKDLTKQGFKEFAKKFATGAAIETGSEMVTGGAQAEEERALGLGNQNFWDGAIESFGPSAVASIIFGGMHHAHVKYQQSQAMKAMENPNTDPKVREQVAQEIHATLSEYDPMIADVWGKTAFKAIQDKAPISTNDDVVELHQKITNLEKIAANSSKAAENLAKLKEQQAKIYGEADQKPLPTAQSDIEDELAYLLKVKQTSGPEDDQSAIDRRISHLQGALEAEDVYQQHRDRISGKPTVPPTEAEKEMSGDQTWMGSNMEDEEFTSIDGKIGALNRYANRLSKAIFNVQGKDSQRAKDAIARGNERLQEVEARVAYLRMRQQDLMTGKATGVAPSEVYSPELAQDLQKEKGQVAGYLPPQTKTPLLPAPGPKQGEIQGKIANLQRVMDIYQRQAKKGKSDDHRARLTGKIQEQRAKINDLKKQLKGAQSSEPIQLDFDSMTPDQLLEQDLGNVEQTRLSPTTQTRTRSEILTNPELKTEQAQGVDTEIPTKSEIPIIGKSELESGLKSVTPSTPRTTPTPQTGAGPIAANVPAKDRNLLATLTTDELARKMIGDRSPEQRSQAMDEIFGSEDELSGYDEGETFPDYGTYARWKTANKYAADIEYAAKDGDEAELKSLLSRAQTEYMKHVQRQAKARDVSGTGPGGFGVRGPGGREAETVQPTQQQPAEQPTEKPSGTPLVRDQAKPGYLPGVRDNLYYKDITDLNLRRMKPREKVELLRDLGTQIDDEGGIRHPGYILIGRGLGGVKTAHEALKQIQEQQRQGKDRREWENMTPLQRETREAENTLKGTDTTPNGKTRGIGDQKSGMLKGTVKEEGTSPSRETLFALTSTTGETNLVDSKKNSLGTFKTQSEATKWAGDNGYRVVDQNHREVLTPGSKYDVTMRTPGSKRATNLKGLTYEKTVGKQYWFKTEDGKLHILSADSIQRTVPTETSGTEKAASKTKESQYGFKSDASYVDIITQVPDIGKIKVNTRAIREKTGEIITVKAPADEALKDLDDSIALYEELLGCVGG